MTLSKNALIGLIAVAVLVVGAGCAQSPPPDPIPAPQADAHPLPPIPSKYPHRKLPKLPGDTRPDRP